MNHVLMGKECIVYVTALKYLIIILIKLDNSVCNE